MAKAKLALVPKDEGEAGKEPVLMGGRIRSLRKKAGLTLAQLAERTGLSVGYLSQIERDLSHPSIRALADIAKVFDISMGGLFQSPAPDRSEESRYIVRRSERAVMHLTPGIREEALSADLDGPLKLFSTTILPGAESGPDPMIHQGAEAGLVTSGEFVLVLEGEPHRLREGDSFSFPSHVRHRFFNDTEWPVVVIWTLTSDESE